MRRNKEKRKLQTEADAVAEHEASAYGRDTLKQLTEPAAPVPVPAPRP